jgi:methylated-DNA-[protein]-cysteine S-methyltransferase
VSDLISADLIVGEDGRARCRWVGTDAEYARYHDQEWGTPLHGDRPLFEKLSLEGFQAGLSWISILRRRYAGAHEAAPTPQLEHVIERIRGLLSGGRDDLADIALDLTEIPPFHRRVYELARAIRPGSTRSYGEIATALGEPHAARAVGQALGANPFPIIVPCHRVLAAGAKAGGFSAPGGTRTKLRLLEIEGAPLGGTPGLFD